MSLLAPPTPVHVPLSPLERYQACDRLQDCWRANIAELTELAVRFHSSDATDGGADDSEVGRRLAQARARLVDIEEAMRRLDTGEYGFCEACRSAIGAGLLLARPDRRHCPDCRPREGEWR